MVLAVNIPRLQVEDNPASPLHPIREGVLSIDVFTQTLPRFPQLSTRYRYLNMPLRRRVVEVKGEPTQIRFSLESPPNSVIDFADLLRSTSPVEKVASESREVDRGRDYRAELRRVRTSPLSRLTSSQSDMQLGTECIGCRGT
jgi:hypothetical protein